jgi:lipoprotein-releasing system ATP-binding protein
MVEVAATGKGAGNGNGNGNGNGKGELALGASAIIKDFGDVRVLHGIDMQVGRGEVVALMGPSGSGKSTLLNIVGLLDRPTSGRIEIDGVDVSALDEAGLARTRGAKLGFIFQFHCLLPDFTALENVLLPSWGHDKGGKPQGMLTERARELLTKVGLGDRLDYPAPKLSGGQSQRVAVARALLHRPSLVLADEPTGNLDTESSRDVLSLMRTFNRELGTAFLIVTHDSRIADKCDRLVEIVDGRVKVHR